MKSNFSFHWFNELYEDSVLYAQQLNAKDDILFDLGDVSRVPSSLLMRIKWVFISHTHLDHFIGFARFLRTNLKILGREIHFFGPEGFICNVEGALNSFTWNLLEYYDINLIVHEVREKKIIQASFHSRRKFKPKILSRQRRKTSRLLENDIFCVDADILNHKTPVLGFRLTEKDRYAVNKDALSQYGFEAGKWIGEVKLKLLARAPKSELVSTSLGMKTLGEIEDKLFLYKKFPAYAYLTDFGYTSFNVERAVKLAKGAHKLFIESNFLDFERSNAEETQHLTALQAGMIAEAADAKEVQLFHFSTRYLENGRLNQEIFIKEMQTGRKIMAKENKE